jgi:hypothetical protein
MSGPLSLNLFTQETHTSQGLKEQSFSSNNDQFFLKSKQS